ncbi:MAG: hypothetical protein EA385_10625, partial [Salinarimonadaceae bacterium]
MIPGLPVAVKRAGPVFNPIVATGGTVTDITVSGRAFRVHTFLSGGDFIVIDPGDEGEVEYLIVAGGGGGGGLNGSGGGGAGGFRKFVAGEAGNTEAGPLTVTATTYPIAVGDGGATNGNGSNSTFSSITSTGGGAGSTGGTAGVAGGSAGGSGNTSGT